MYLTFEQALSKIKPTAAKNANYHMTRIRQLINEGKLIEAKPEIYVKCGEAYKCLGKICTERLVTEESVNAYVELRNQMRREYGKIPKPNRRVKAVFSDGSHSFFDNIELACKFFNISRGKLMRSIKKNKAIEIPIIEQRRTDLVISEDIKTESVRFY